MNELLKKLFESELLNDETKAQLQEAIESQLKDVIAETKVATEDAVRLELAEKWVQTRDTLVEAIDTKVTDLLEQEIKELKDDLAAYKDQEVVYAEKLNEAKEVMTKQVEADMAQLIEKLNSFLELRINHEFAELKESIEEAQKVDFGRRMFEAFASEYQVKFVDENEVNVKLAEAEAQLQAVTAKLNEATISRAKVERTLKLENLLKPLSGNHRQLMETILSTVQTADLDKAYGKFIGRVLKEDAAPAANTDTKIVNEGAATTEDTAGTKVVTGDSLTESSNVEPAFNALSTDEKRKLQRMAGIVH